MKTPLRISVPLGALIAFSLGPLFFAQEAPSSAEASTPAQLSHSPANGVVSPDVPASPPAPAAPSSETPVPAPVRVGARPDREIVSMFSDAIVPEGKSVDSAVAIAGDVIVNGTARQAVAIAGSVTANTKVGQTVSIVGSNTVNAGAEQAVAVVGNVYVNSHVTGQVVAVGGGVELGPDARVDGQVIALGGGITRAPTSSIGGEVVEVKLLKNIGGFNAWVTRCLAKGRLLAFAPGLTWAWLVTGVFLLFYVIVSLIFPKAVAKSAEMFELHPGCVLLAAFLTMIIKPVLGIVLTVTIVGPLVFGLACLVLAAFALTAIRAWIGRRITLPLGLTHPAVAVLIGGVLLALGYAVPLLGMVLWMLGRFLGEGMVVYAVIMTIRRGRAKRAAALAVEKASREAAAATAAVAADSGAAAGAPAAATPGASALDASSTPVAPAAPITPITPVAYVAHGAHVTPQTDAAIAPRAGFWVRTGALLIDILMMAVIAKICHASALFAPLFVIYCVVMWALRGTTIGGIVCGLKIVRLDGRPVDWATSVVRALGGFLSILPAGLGFIWLAFDDERQSWHDKIAGTVVVHAPKGQSLI
jgi:uncharacterized RDD family membrane protein YckC